MRTPDDPPATTSASPTRAEALPLGGLSLGGLPFGGAGACAGGLTLSPPWCSDDLVTMGWRPATRPPAAETDAVDALRGNSSMRSAPWAMHARGWAEQPLRETRGLLAYRYVTFAALRPRSALQLSMLPAPRELDARGPALVIT